MRTEKSNRVAWMDRPSAPLRAGGDIFPSGVRGFLLRVTDVDRQPFRSMGFVSVIIVSVLFAPGLPLVCCRGSSEAERTDGPVSLEAVLARGTRR